MLKALKVHLGVNGGGLDVLVPEDIGYLLERGPFPEHPGGEGVPQNMRTMGGLTRKAVQERPSHSYAYRRSGYRPTDRGCETYKNMASPRWRSSVQVCGQRFSRFCGKREVVDPARLGLAESHAAFPPVDIIELQVGHLSRAESYRYHEKSHGPTAEADKGVHVERREESGNLLFPEVLWYGRQAPMGDRWNGIFQGKLYLARESQEAEEGPKSGAVQFNRFWLIQCHPVRHRRFHVSRRYGTEGKLPVYVMPEETA